ncbi:protein TAPT1 [Aphis craccivora]|uniref:Protein TAPT1 n=1 Tax=Aphis craccivora TaxID=307492 RepID=A0A6G0YNE6_APHCR|nr:protein TAPT1 [Aphis craccivora]
MIIIFFFFLGTLWDFILIEFNRGYSLENDEKEFSDRREKIYTFMKVPLEVERFIFYGICQCADSFLFVYTFLPLRVFVALKSLICSSLSKFKDKHDKIQLTAAEICDLLKMAVLIICFMMLVPLDTSMIYHLIKSQSVIKLYIFFNMLEVGDKLLSSFGQDILDALYWTATEPNTSQLLKDKTNFPQYIILVSHSILVLCQTTILNVAINSRHKALLPIMMSNNFIEFNGSVFKKFNETTLFELSCSDVRERFHLFILLLMVVVQTLKEYQWTSESFGELMLNCMYILISEVIIDWLKHAFITKFNEINLSVYNNYILNFAKDTVQSYYKKAFSDHSDVVARRMGLIPIPLGVVITKVLIRCVPFDELLMSIIILLSIFTCLFTFKIVNLVYILGRASKLTDLHKTPLLKNNFIKNDIVNTTISPQNKDNKPSLLVEVPPMEHIPIIMNSNVSMKNNFFKSLLFH